MYAMCVNGGLAVVHNVCVCLFVFVEKSKCLQWLSCGKNLEPASTMAFAAAKRWQCHGKIPVARINGGICHSKTLALPIYHSKNHGSATEKIVEPASTVAFCLSKTMAVPRKNNGARINDGILPRQNGGSAAENFWSPHQQRRWLSGGLAVENSK